MEELKNVNNATPNLDEELLLQLRNLIPEAFPDNELDAGALLDALKLSGVPHNSFSFSWPGIEQARSEASAATTATLIPDQKASVNWDSARDALIEGDNLQVLKLLKSGYSNQAKLIYIDPPYNTGETFTYDDSFAVPESEYLRSTGQVDESGNATTSRIETAGRKHAPWLSMMFSRLAVARHLLRRDGVILVSIDNNEVHHLRLLLDALFGAANFVDMFTWQGGRKGDAKYTAGGQDYILVYARDLIHLKQLNTRWREKKTGLELVYAQEKMLLEKHAKNYVTAKTELREWFSLLPEGNPAKQHAHYNQIDQGGVWTSDNSSSPNYRENLIYDFKGFSPPENGWRYEKPTMERLDKEGRLIYPTGRATRIRIKKYLHEQERWAPASTFYRDRSGASSALEALMGVNVFDNPKNVDVLARLISAMTVEDDLIIDFFAGSGSTGQAVWEQNVMDKARRNWILVQAPELPNGSEETGKNAIEQGYKTIFEITAERLRRAAARIDASGALGFRVFRAAPTNLSIEPAIKATTGMTGAEYMQTALLKSQGSPVNPTTDPTAVAWEVAIKTAGTKLDAIVKEIILDEVKVFEFVPAHPATETGRLLISMDAFTLTTADALKLSGTDMLILRGDKVDDSVCITLSSQLQSKLIMLERTPREVSL